MENILTVIAKIIVFSLIESLFLGIFYVIIITWFKMWPMYLMTIISLIFFWVIVYLVDKGIL